MKKIIYLSFIINIILGCKAQEKIMTNISCKGNVVIQYEKGRHDEKDRPHADVNLNAFTVYFINEYDDDIQAFVNDKLYYDKHLKIEGGEDSLKEYFGYNYSKDSKKTILKVLSKTDNSCFDVEVDKKYKLIYVFKSNSRWTVRFSNIYYIN